MRRTYWRLKGQAGWTLTELVMVVAILAVTVSIAAPSSTRTVNGMRLSTLTNDLLAQLNLARAEAIRCGARVALCAAATSDACSTASGWEQGWIVFEDSNDNGLRDAPEPVIRARPAAPSGWSIRGNGPVAHYVSYHPLGGSLTVSGAFQAGSITICQASAQATTGARVVLNSLGRSRSQRVDLPNCG